jgi:hypothetical protein
VVSLVNLGAQSGQFTSDFQAQIGSKSKTLTGTQTADSR